MVKSVNGSKMLPLIVAGIIFTIIAVAHLLRLIYGFEIMIGNNVISMKVSWVGMIVSGILALWMFVASQR